MLMSMAPGSHTLCYRDAASRGSRAKPKNASELQLFVAITDLVFMRRSGSTLSRQIHQDAVCGAIRPKG